VIEFQAAVAQTNEAQRDFADLQKKFEPKRQQLKVLNDEIDGMQKQLKSDQEKLSQADMSKRARAIADKQKQLKRDYEDSQKEFQGAMQQVLGTVGGKVYEVLLDYVKKQGFTIVIDATLQQQSAPIILYADQSSDITKTIIDAYNVKSGVPAPVTPAGKAAPATAPHAAPKAPAK
jgi:outer membrane protein